MKGSLLHRYSHDLPLRYQFLTVNLLLLLATALIVLAIYTETAKLVTQNAISSETALITQTENTIEASVKNVTTVMDSISSSSFLSQLSYAEDPDEFLSDPQTASEADDFLEAVQALIDGQLITAVRIYLNPELSDICGAFSSSGIFLPISDVRSSYWHGIFTGTPSARSLMCPEFYLTKKEISSCGSLAYIAKYSTVSYRGSREPFAYIAVYFSLTELENILFQNRTGNDSVYYILNSRDNSVVSSDANLSGLYYLAYDRIPQIITNTEGFTEAEILKTALYMSYRDISGTDWRLVSVIPKDSLSSGEQALFRSISLLYILLGLIVLMLEIFLTNSITGRITRITRHLSPSDQAIPDKLPSSNHKDEIGQLITAYNATVDQINALVQTQARISEKLKISEVQALQAQINPHFLYNMLDMINWLSIDEKQEQVSEAVQSLSKFYKLTLSRKTITVTLREELRHAELYVKLQNMRFDHGIEFLIDVPDEILDCEIPKLVLQPIVENAVLHGICEKPSKKGNIVIMAWCLPAWEKSVLPDSSDSVGAVLENSLLSPSGKRFPEEDIIITVSDNGVGMSPEMTASILSERRFEAKSSGSGSNIAIFNTHQRLQLIYGKGYGLRFSSEEGRGTDVEVRIPKIAGKDAAANSSESKIL